MPGPHALNPFAVLGLEPALRLSPAEVDRAYLARIASAHPDTNTPTTNTGDSLSQDSYADPAMLHGAKATLKDAERRANALLALVGGPGPEADKALPEGFLMDIMATRESVESDLAANPDGARERWGAWAEAERARYLDELDPLFAAARADPGDAASRREIRVRLNAWRYVERLAEQLDPDYDPARADFGR